MSHHNHPLDSEAAPWTAGPPRQGGLVLTVLCTAAFMATLDVFIVNVAFAAIARDLHGSFADVSWILNGYAIAYAALLVPLGRLADRYGRKAGFLVGVGLFSAAGAACAASASLGMLIGFRIAQAIGAAALTPTSLGLLLGATAPQDRARAVRIWAASGALAAALGPVLGGLLVQASWQWVFLVNIPVGVIALVATARYVPDSRDPAVGRLPDVPGAIVLAAAVGALTLSLVKGPDWGWGSANSILSFAVALVGVGIFVYRMGHHPAPIVEPALLRVRAFAWSNVTSLLFSLAFGASLLSILLWMQDVWHYSALQTGLAVAPGPLMVPLLAALSQRIAHRVPAGAIAAAGSFLFGLGNAVLATVITPEPHYLNGLLPAWLIMGAGVGLTQPTIVSAATADLPPARHATGSAVVMMDRQIGTSLGVSLLVAILGVVSSSPDVLAAYQRAWWAVAIVAFISTVAAFGMTPPRRSAPVERPLATPGRDASSASTNAVSGTSAAYGAATSPGLSDRVVEGR